MDKLSRRRFFRLLPALVAAPLAQWPYSGESEPPGADTPVNLTWRVTSLEAKDVIRHATITTMAENIKQLWATVGQTGDLWQGRRRGT